MDVYDINVEYDALVEIEKKLIIIQKNLNFTNEDMDKAIKRSQNFLAGKQFEKACEATKKSMETSKKVVKDIEYAKKYISELKDNIEQYGKCKYEEKK